MASNHCKVVLQMQRLLVRGKGWDIWRDTDEGVMMPNLLKARRLEPGVRIRAIFHSAIEQSTIPTLKQQWLNLEAKIFSL